MVSLRNELALIHEDMAKEKELLFSVDGDLHASHSNMVQALTDLQEHYDQADKVKNAEWKLLLDRLSEENYRIERSWQDIADQEAELEDKKLALLHPQASSAERQQEIDNARARIGQARTLLRLEEESVAAHQQSEMENVEADMDNWAQEKENAMASVRKQCNDLLCGKSSAIAHLLVRSDEKVLEIQARQDECCDAGRFLKRFDDDFSQQLAGLSAEREDLLRRKGDKELECSTIKLQQESLEQDVDSRLKQLDDEHEQEMRRISDDRDR